MEEKKPVIKTKRIGFIIAAAVVLVLAAAWLWYTRPMTLGQFCPGVDLSRCTEIRGTYRLQGSDPVSVSLTPEDPEFDALLAQLRDRGFRRSVWGLLSSGAVKTHAGYSEKDTCWDVQLIFDEPVTLANGEASSGSLIWFDNFYGSVDLHFAGQEWNRISTADKQSWLLDVQALLTVSGAA